MHSFNNPARHRASLETGGLYPFTVSAVGGDQVRYRALYLHAPAGAPEFTQFPLRETYEEAQRDATRARDQLLALVQKAARLANVDAAEGALPASQTGLIGDPD